MLTKEPIQYNNPNKPATREYLSQAEIDYRIAEIKRMRADDRNWKYIAAKLFLHRDTLQDFRIKHGLMNL